MTFYTETLKNPHKTEKVQHGITLTQKTVQKKLNYKKTNKDKMQTWNHLAWRRDANAVRHFCLSRASGGSLTDSVSIGRWNKKTMYSLTKGVFLSHGQGERRQITPPKAVWRGEEGELPHA